MITDAQIEAVVAVLTRHRSDVPEHVIYHATRTARAALEAAERAAWQPIETAPKDGTEVLLIISAYNDPSRGRAYVIARWEWGGWIDDEEISIHPPTHWRPLPQPPGEEEMR